MSRNCDFCMIEIDSDYWWKLHGYTFCTKRCAMDYVRHHVERVEVDKVDG